MKKQLIITLTVLILAITLAGAVSATEDPDSVKYVSPTGNDDNDGTETNPYLTIGKGITSVSADGTVNVADGTYYEHLTINKNLNLVGQSQENTILDGSHTGQPITINTGVTVNISLFTIQNGVTDIDGGGIFNRGNLTVSGSSISGNTAYSYGGGIYNHYGTVTVTDTSFTSNTATYGGAIYNYDGGTVTISDSIISGNNAVSSGGITNHGTLNVVNSTISDNTASNSAGGISNTGILTVSDSTISGNTAPYYGGGIITSGTLTVSGSTISGNTAQFGGGINNWYGTVIANFNRIVNNSPTAIHNVDGSVDAEYNWWGSNNPDFTTLISGVVDYNPWLYMTLQANPNTIVQGETSTLSANFNNAFDGTTVTPLNPADGHLPDGTLVTFKTDLGEVGSQAVDKPTISGVATATLNGTESGLATVNAALDDEELSDTVEIETAEYNLTVNFTGQGTATKNPDMAYYPMGTVVTLTAVADPGWSFSHWTGDLTGNTNPHTMTMDGDKSVTAVFVEEYVITTGVSGQGSVTRNPDLVSYVDGTVVTVTAVADPGWSFSHWTGDFTGNTNPHTMTMDGDKSVTAVFVEDAPETGIFTRLMVQDAARRVRNFITNRGVLPNWVRMEDTAGVTHYVTMPVFLELSTASLISSANEFKAMDVQTAPRPTGPSIVNRNLYRTGYLNMALRVNNFIRNNGLAPNFASSSLGNIRFQSLVDSFARIVAFKAERKVLPNYVVINTRRVR